jgi:hypothetical protein
MGHDDPPNITCWRFGDVAARLLGENRFTFRNPPPSWSPWKEPTAESKLPIDDVITRLRHSNRGPRLRSREDLNALGLACPYYAARWAIALAVENASVVAINDDPTQILGAWRKAEEAFQKIREGTEMVEALLKARLLWPRWPLLRPPAINQVCDTMVELLRSGVLKHAEDDARIAQKTFRNNQGDIWKLSFVAELGLAWRALTGTNPARTDPFADFIAAAYESVTDKPGEISWERTVRRVLKLGIDWVCNGK